MEIQGNELILYDDSLIISKTDLHGYITYANIDFIKFSGYTEEELIGTNHNIIRHPLMPRIIFKVLWDTIKSGKEINAFVVNQNKDKFDYWVYANITPSFNNQGKIVGYYSVRRKPNKKAIPIIRDIYTKLLHTEQEAKSKGENDIEASQKLFAQMLNNISMNHQAFFITLQKNGALS